ncbi:MAG: glycosyltransferase [Polyangiales bacterium]
MLSKHTEARLLQAGFPPKRLRRIVPALPALDALSKAERTRERVALGLDPDKALVIYAGDLEFGGGAELCLAACQDMDVQLVMACRSKTPRAAEVEAQLRRRGNATWVGETPRIHALLGCADAVLLPGTSLYAKMDYPLVILEAMSMGQPVVVGAGTPAEELVEGGAIISEPSVQGVRASITAALSGGAALGERGAAYVRERFAAGHVANQYEALYDEVLGER